MIEARSLDPNYAVTGQIGPVDVAEAARLGYKTIICNRPDDEGGPEQPSAAENRKAAESAGMKYLYIPMTPDTLSPQMIEAVRKAIDESPGPILAHCKSGARSALLYALAHCCHKNGEVDEILGRAEKEGYDLWKMKPVIEKYVAEHRNC